MFKDVIGYPGYKVNENSIVINKNGHVMRPALSKNGRLRVSLEIYDDDGKLIRRDNKSIYRLSAQAFLPNPDNLPLVMHLDNDTLHNHISNLKWGTNSENILQAYNDGIMVSPNLDVHIKNLYEVSNIDKSEVIKCKGREGVSNLIGISEKSIGPGVIKSGPYKGYTIENTHIRIEQPVIFKKQVSNVSASSVNC